MDDVKLLVEERRDRIDVLTTWLPRIALAIVFVSVGAQKFAAHSMWVRIFDEIGFGRWFRHVAGAMQIGGGVLLLIPRAAAVGFMLVGCTMVGAVAFWILMHHAFGAIVPGGLLLAVAGFGWPDVARFAVRLRRRTATGPACP
jgi:putative oxidoreductase